MKEKLCYVGYDIHAEQKLAQGRVPVFHDTNSKLNSSNIYFEKFPPPHCFFLISLVLENFPQLKTQKKTVK